MLQDVLHTLFPYGIEGLQGVFWVCLINIGLRAVTGWLWLSAVRYFFPAWPVLYNFFLIGFVIGNIGDICRPFGPFIAPLFKPKVCRWVLDRVALKGHERVLDVGCASGAMTLEVARHLSSGTVVGVDDWDAGDRDRIGITSDTVHERATQMGESNRIDIVEANLDVLPFPDQHFDVVISGWAFGFWYGTTLQDRQKVLWEMIRVVKREGVIAVVDIRRCDEFRDWFAKLGFHIQFFGSYVTLDGTHWLLVVHRQSSTQ